jgi:hypothetical protein
MRVQLQPVAFAAERQARREIRIGTTAFFQIAAKGEAGATCQPRQEGDIRDPRRSIAVPTALSEQNPCAK